MNFFSGSMKLNFKALKKLHVIFGFSSLLIMDVEAEYKGYSRAYSRILFIKGRQAEVDVQFKLLPSMVIHLCIPHCRIGDLRSIIFYFKKVNLISGIGIGVGSPVCVR